jgi:hypothetical protein
MQEPSALRWRAWAVYGVLVIVVIKLAVGVPILAWLLLVPRSGQSMAGLVPRWLVDQKTENANVTEQAVAARDVDRVSGLAGAPPSTVLRLSRGCMR